jgi:hypothetical protein
MAFLFDPCVVVKGLLLKDVAMKPSKQRPLLLPLVDSLNCVRRVLFKAEDLRRDYVVCNIIAMLHEVLLNAQLPFLLRFQSGLGKRPPSRNSQLKHMIVNDIRTVEVHVMNHSIRIHWTQPFTAKKIPIDLKKRPHHGKEGHSANSQAIGP